MCNISKPGWTHLPWQCGTNSIVLDQILFSRLFLTFDLSAYQLYADSGSSSEKDDSRLRCGFLHTAVKARFDRVIDLSEERKKGSTIMLDRFARAGASRIKRVLRKVEYVFEVVASRV